MAFPWNKQEALLTAKKLGLLPEGERVLAEVAESTEAAILKSRAARPLAEVASPEGTLALTRQMREVDSVMGPGKSSVHVLLARYARLDEAVERMTTLLRRGRRVETPRTRRVLLARMDHELKQFATLKSQIAARANQDLTEIRKALQAGVDQKLLKELGALKAADVRQECRAALDELEQALQNQRKALANAVDGRLSAKAFAERAQEQITALAAGGGSGARKVISSRVRRVAQLTPQPQKLGMEFGKKMKRRVGRALPAINEIEDSSLVFIEAIGVVAQARPDGARLLRRYVEEGKTSLKARELEKVEGYLGQMRGLMPEEVATNMKFLESVFQKSAFEALADFPPELRKQMGVELVEGPLWVLDKAGPPRQFGDGCLLLTGPKGQSAIIGLGEFKAGFDEDLLRQLFVRSDGRAVDSTVTFLGRNLSGEGGAAEKQVRRLTREFEFEGGKKVALNKPPSYVYGRSGGESPETAALFKEMVEEQMKSGREVWKVPLPFDANANQKFADEALKEAVNTVKRLNQNWGR